MQTNILWEGREYHSLENCIIDTTESGSLIQSTIVGAYEGKIFQVDYEIRTNAAWETLSVQLKSRHSNVITHMHCESDGKGGWKIDGKEAAQFDGCIDVDISLTPFTNTLPIRRLRWTDGVAQPIRVFYFNILEGQTRPMEQCYTRLSASEYLYENRTRDFKAKLTVDEQGLVIDYPELSVRKAALSTDYPLSNL